MLQTMCLELIQATRYETAKHFYFLIIQAPETEVRVNPQYAVYEA